jgi:hypothetical protein
VCAAGGAAVPVLLSGLALLLPLAAGGLLLGWEDGGIACADLLACVPEELLLGLTLALLLAGVLVVLLLAGGALLLLGEVVCWYGGGIALGAGVGAACCLAAWLGWGCGGVYLVGRGPNLGDIF